MKRFIFTFIILFIVGACKDDDSPAIKKVPLKIDINELTLTEGDISTIKITSGNGDYKVSSNKEEVATAEVHDKKIIITAKSSGEAIITITDKAIKENEEITVKVNSAATANIENVSYYISSTKLNGTSIDGKISHQEEKKIVVKIPYTNGNGEINEVNIEKKTAQGQGGDIKTLTLHIPKTKLEVNGELIATISANEEYTLKDMPPGESYDIAVFDLEIANTQAQVTLKGIGGIPDKLFNIETNNELEHQFIYLPVVAADGRVWLNNNLGADYSNMNKDIFNPEKQADFENDHYAYGSMFQWQRKADGHELINWEDDFSGTAKHNTEWRDELFNYGASNLWQANGENNPCPNGFYVPTKEDIDALLSALGDMPDRVNADQTLKLTNTGHRNYQGEFREVGDLGLIWTSTQYKDKKNKGHMAWELNFDYLHSDTYGTLKSNAQPVRCIKN